MLVRTGRRMERSEIMVARGAGRDVRVADHGWTVPMTTTGPDTERVHPRSAVCIRDRAPDTFVQLSPERNHRKPLVTPLAAFLTRGQESGVRDGKGGAASRPPPHLMS